MRPNLNAWVYLSLFSLLSACSSNENALNTGTNIEDASANTTQGPVTLTPSNIVEELSAAVCEKLTSCCNENDQINFFSNFVDDERLEALAPLMPPNNALTAENCPGLLQELYPQIWLGSWLERIEAREVIFDTDGAHQCMAELKSASCGPEVRTAIFDTSCFANQPPSGGELQRRLFSRLPRFDEACAPIRDGFGGLYFGSCDPNRSFCCVPADELDGGCNPFPVPGKVGTCQPAAELGDDCNDLPLKLCKTGLFCDDADYTCKDDSYEPLALGQSCMDESYAMLGECVDSYCNWETFACTPLKATGESCLYSYQCTSDFCDFDLGECIEDPRCEMP